MTIDLDTLEFRAVVATPGPWKTADARAMSIYDEIRGADGERIATTYSTRNPFDLAEANAAFIAAANPATVLELIAELRKARAAQEWITKIIVSHHDACAHPCKCGGRPPCEAECVKCWLNAASKAVEEQDDDHRP